MDTLITGVKPTGSPHLGNYAGAIRPAIEDAAGAARSLVFIADAHALNALRDPDLLSRYVRDVAVAYLACGVDPSRTLFFRQSDVPEIFELSALLGCFCPKGLVNRGHAFKAAVDANRARGRDADDGINLGLFGYPVLMAADILAFDATVVPVGADQRQHLEITRALARRLNRQAGPGTVVVPAVRVRRGAAEVPGVDGRKMSKSYGNTISLVAERDEIQAAVARFVTDGRQPGEAASPEATALYRLVHAVDPDGAASVAERLRAGAGYAEVKRLAVDVLDRHVEPLRRRARDLRGDPGEIERLLARGAEGARAVAGRVLLRVKRSLGLGPLARNAVRRAV